MDTVPPYIPPAYDGTKVTGRGANDAKGCDISSSSECFFSFLYSSFSKRICQELEFKN